MNLVSAKNVLVREVQKEQTSHTRKDLWGNAGSVIKIQEYAIASAEQGQTVEECKNWFKQFLEENSIEDKSECGKYSEIVGFMQSVVSRYISKSKKS